MRTDKELLELAAKACGYDISHPFNSERLTLDPPVNALWIKDISTGWDPLTDDGDAFRLSVKLGMCIDCSWTRKVKTSALRKELEKALEEPWGEDRNAATRRAIVRAAAAIGETM